jgi:hypothetical protein
MRYNIYGTRVLVTVRHDSPDTSRTYVTVTHDLFSECQNIA